MIEEYSWKGDENLYNQVQIQRIHSMETKNQCTWACPFFTAWADKGRNGFKGLEKNLEESKNLAREAKEACLNTLLVVDMGMAKFDGSVILDTLGQIEIERSKEISKKNRESVQSAIQQVDHVDLQMINDLLVKQSLQH